MPFGAEGVGRDGTQADDGMAAPLKAHALTGNADVGSWWGELVGPGRPVDTGEYFVVCANALGGCYGTCGPTSFGGNCDTEFRT